jgi:hypothetical protein
VAQIKAGNDSTGGAAADSGSQAVSATGAQTPSATGLVAGTTYYAYFQHADAVGNDSSVVASSSFATDSAGATLTLDPLKNNTGTVIANETGIEAFVYNKATGALVVHLTGQASNASGVVTLTDASLVSATEYRVVLVLQNGDEGMGLETAA